MFIVILGVKPTIIRFENNEASPNTTTVNKITAAINKGGVVFTEKGVEYPGSILGCYRGEDRPELFKNTEFCKIDFLRNKKAA